MNAIEISNITMSYNRKNVLCGINLSIPQGGIFALTGPNGSGKSTLAKILMGILKPSSGEIWYNGKNITDYTIDQRAKLGFSFGFQQPITFKGLTVKDLLDIASNKKNTLSVACEYLSKVGLCAKDYINRQIDNKLSGGELKRIEIAMVLAKNGEVNIFDEPEAGIDLWSFEQLIKIFKEQNTTSIIISHQSKIIDIADRVILLKNGKVEHIGTKEQVMPLIEQQKCKKLKESEI